MVRAFRAQGEGLAGSHARTLPLAAAYSLRALSLGPRVGCLAM